MSGLFTERFQLPVGRWEDVPIKPNLREAQEVGGHAFSHMVGSERVMIWG